LTSLPLPSNPLIGLWRLLAIRAIYVDGSVAPEVYGPDPVGYLSYSAPVSGPDSGHMMVMFERRDRALLSGNPTSPFSLESVPAAELAQAFTSFSAYAGTYTLHGDHVHHHLTTASLPNRVGTTLVRQFSLSGDGLLAPLDERLTLRTPELMKGGSPLVFELVWQRLG
jgi:hypothetical protein